MTNTSKKAAPTAITMHSAVATFATPSGDAAGGSFATICDGGVNGNKVSRDGSIKIKNVFTAAVTLSAVQPCIYDAAGDWCQLGLANGGNNIVLAAGESFRIPVYDLPALGSRAALKATVTGATPQVTVTYEALDAVGG